MENHNYVFISYKSEEYNIVKRFANILKENDIDYWMAPDSIPIGSDYAAEITSAIENCGCVALMLSNHSISSEYVQKEIHTAISKKKLIFPLSIDTYQLNKTFEFLLSNVQIKSLIFDSYDVINIIISDIKAALDSNCVSSNNVSNPVVTIQSELEKAVEYYQNNYYELALPIFQKNSENDISQLYLGRMFNDGLAVEQNLDKALYYYKHAVSNGNTDAMYYMSEFYYLHDEIEENYTKAREYAEMLLTHNGEMASDAYNILGLIYSEGLEVEQDLNKAEQYFKNSANLKNACGYLNLAKFYEDNSSFGVDKTYIDELYEKSANLNDSNALLHFAKKYYSSDNPKAFEYANKSVKFGNKEAIHYLACCYNKGIGVEPCLSRAVELFLISISNGFTKSMIALGKIYEEPKYRNYAEAKKLYEKALEQGDTNAYFRLGWLYDNGLGVEQDYDKAIEYYKYAADLGSEAAMNNIGVIYYRLENEEEAQKWYQKAQESGNDTAIENLADRARDEGNFERAFELYLESANKGNASAMVEVGSAYRDGRGVIQDTEEAKCWFEKACEAGSIAGFFYLGTLYDSPEYGMQDYEKALEYYTQGANQNDSACMKNIGLIYEDDSYEGKDINKAILWYKKAVKLGNSRAMILLGQIYETEEYRNYAEAKKLYEKALECGDTDANFRLGWLYNNGLGVEQDYDKAIEYYKYAADLGSEVAMYNIGSIYGILGNEEEAQKWYQKAQESGDDTAIKKLADQARDEGNFERAFDLYLEAANKGNADAMDEVGRAYRDGRGVIQDTEEAKCWFEKACEAGSIVGFFYLGTLYDSPKYGMQDFEKALEYYTQGANQNISDCMNKIGIIYEDDSYEGKDKNKAISWYKKAIKFGSSQAMVRLGRIYETEEYHNYTEAKKLYELAISNNNQKALSSLGKLNFEKIGTPNAIKEGIKCFENGIEKHDIDCIRIYAKYLNEGKIIPKNIKFAHELFKKAADLDDIESLEYLGKLGIRLFNSKEEKIQSLLYLERAIELGSKNAKEIYEKKNLKKMRQKLIG